MASCLDAQRQFGQISLFKARLKLGALLRLVTGVGKGNLMFAPVCCADAADEEYEGEDTHPSGGAREQQVLLADMRLLAEETMRVRFQQHRQQVDRAMC